MIAVEKRFVSDRVVFKCWVIKGCMGLVASSGIVLAVFHHAFEHGAMRNDGITVQNLLRLSVLTVTSLNSWGSRFDFGTIERWKSVGTVSCVFVLSYFEMFHLTAALSAALTTLSCIVLQRSAVFPIIDKCQSLISVTPILSRHVAAQRVANCLSCAMPCACHH